MSTGVSIAIPLGFLLLGGTLCWYVAHAKGHWAPKLLLTGFVAFFSLETWRALDSYAGWPAEEEMPQKALLISAIVREPNFSKNDRGAIFLWVVPIGRDDPGPFAYDPISGEPRAYELPYSRAMHEQTAAAMKAMRQNGRPILIEREGLPGDEEGDPHGNGADYGDETDSGFRMRELPPPTLPEKTPR